MFTHRVTFTLSHDQDDGFKDQTTIDVGADDSNHAIALATQILRNKKPEVDIRFITSVNVNRLYTTRN